GVGRGCGAGCVGGRFWVVGRRASRARSAIAPVVWVSRAGSREGLALGVAVAAAAMADPELGEFLLEAAGGEGGAVVAAGRRLAPLDRVHERGACDDRDRFVGAAPELELRGHAPSRAALHGRVRAAAAVLGDPDAGHLEPPELPGTLDPKRARPRAGLERTPALDRLPLPQQPERPLAVDGDAEPAPRERRHDPLAVGLVVASD